MLSQGNEYLLPGVVLYGPSPARYPLASNLLHGPYSQRIDGRHATSRMCVDKLKMAHT